MTKTATYFFGCVLDEELFERVRQRLERSAIEFIAKPQTRYAGQTFQQQTMLVLDFSDNPLEFKLFKNQTEVFSL